MKNDQPNNGEYFRGFLYDINWEFPYYNNENIVPYRIVSPFDNFLNNITNIPEIYNEYYNALIDTPDASYGTNMVPYNLLFDLFLPQFLFFLFYNIKLNKKSLKMLLKLLLNLLLLP